MWKEAVAKNGTPYFYHTTSLQRSWTRPAEFQPFAAPTESELARRGLGAALDELTTKRPAVLAVSEWFFDLPASLVSEFVDHALTAMVFHTLARVF